jgi:5'-3' exonuclease
MKQALTGDAADNIPGVKGIGPKTAAALVSHFGSVADMYTRLRLGGGEAAADGDGAGAIDVDAYLAQVAPPAKAKRGKKAAVAAAAAEAALTGDGTVATVAPSTVAAALAEMEASLVGVRAGGVATLKKLAACRAQDVALYRRLVTLRPDVPLTPTAEASDDASAATALAKDALLYVGERLRAADVDLEGMSASFAEPLRLLRQRHRY